MHSGRTTSSAPWRTASFTSCVESSIFCLMSPSRASVWAAAARKRFFFISLRPDLAYQALSVDLTLKDAETVAFELNKSSISHAFGVSRPRQVDFHEISYSRRPAGQQQNPGFQLHGFFDIMRDHQRPCLRFHEDCLQFLTHEDRHLIVQRLESLTL